MTGNNTGTQHNNDNPNITKLAVRAGNRSTSSPEARSMLSVTKVLMLIISTITKHQGAIGVNISGDLEDANLHCFEIDYKIKQVTCSAGAKGRLASVWLETL